MERVVVPTRAASSRMVAELIPQGRIVPIRDSCTFTPIDQPGATAEAIVSFLRDTEQGHDAK